MAELALYNTFSRKKEIFTPADPNRVTMYVCGPTVYNLAHIGNARPVVVFDTLNRVLRSRYPNVIYARNITDIDDKIIEAARSAGTDIKDVTDEFTAKYREDMGNLNTLIPDIEPHATDNIGPMLDLMERLLAGDHAYVAEGHVLFAVDSMAEYGQLSGRSLDDMLAGARVEVASYKRHPGDFVLWKPSSDDEPGWESPWGRGRPGWHLECSAMIKAHLGDTIDIHGGGRDLIFPHHENERAQSCCAYGGEFVRYWMHNAYLDMDGEKMSKSLGNVRTVRELLQSYRGEVLRFALLSAHYRSELTFSESLLDNAKSALDSFYSALRQVADTAPEAVEASETAVAQALLDDLNTPQAIAELHAVSKRLNKAEEAAIPRLKGELLAAGKLLGLLQHDPVDWLTSGLSSGSGEGLSADEIEGQIAARAAAKADKDFAAADAIRDALASAGIVLEDSAAGTTWRRQ
ncbi:cysteinyl-tRNA synthetase [Luminiphilus syltensis NOR5-1B]|uniref:Cysteine--tRNA ligase n=1 Tax=Luminiphilus syltensis NOR5-1B TaxID=565045 RepID=B8KYF3_9GAMM|nr:cysteine--tRNA ligase [Luminiphilus syltensis]EED34386.1 cysteinyl-tRNA synthetase [Luminiphilus syltensis NOR5-1B]